MVRCENFQRVRVVHATWDDGCADVVALLFGKDCGAKIDQMIALAASKMTTQRCTKVRISRADQGWQVAGWHSVTFTGRGGTRARRGGRRLRR